MRPTICDENGEREMTDEEYNVYSSIIAEPIPSHLLINEPPE